MLNELVRLSEVPELYDLLGHYATLATPDRQAWQDRVLEKEGLGTRDLVRLHGELLAHGWIEQNTGSTPVLRKGSAPGCYRVTPSGLRALKQFRAGDLDGD